MTEERFVTAENLVERWPALFPDARRVYALAAEGIVPCVRVARRVHFDVEAIERWIEGGGRALPGGWRREPVAGGDPE